MITEINDKNSIYIGDAVYIVFDEYKRLWLCTYYLDRIDNQICLEDEVIENFLRTLIATGKISNYGKVNES